MTYWPHEDRPDMDNIPEEGRELAKRLYAEMRAMRRGMENFFWIFTIYAGFVLLAVWLYATDEKKGATAAHVPSPSVSQSP